MDAKKIFFLKKTKNSSARRVKCLKLCFEETLFEMRAFFGGQNLEFYFMSELH